MFTVDQLIYGCTVFKYYINVSLHCVITEQSKRPDTPASINNIYCALHNYTCYTIEIGLDKQRPKTASSY